tara:strand:- start:58 stop:330 length:273 start_codon:yes stop_codon:yes gene_type:complete
MEYENLLSELRRLGRSRQHILKVKNSENQEKKFFIIPSDIMLGCCVYVLKDIHTKDISCRNLAELEETIIGMDIEFNNSFLQSFFTNVTN